MVGVLLVECNGGVVSYLAAMNVAIHPTGACRTFGPAHIACLDRYAVDSHENVTHSSARLIEYSSRWLCCPRRCGCLFLIKPQSVR